MVLTVATTMSELGLLQLHIEELRVLVRTNEPNRGALIERNIDEANTRSASCMTGADPSLSLVPPPSCHLRIPA